MFKCSINLALNASSLFNFMCRSSIFQHRSPAMASSSISVTALALWLCLVAATLATSTWAMRDLVEVEDHQLPTEFTTQPAVISGPAANCFPGEISITQQMVPGHPGISKFLVQIVNTSASAIRKIIVNCGAFASATPIDSNTFHRVGAGPTCIVNNGNALASHQMLGFSYEQKSIQPLSLASAECVP
jgi:hypothetical protein